MVRLSKLITLKPSDWIALVLAYRWLFWAKRQMSSGRLVGRDWLDGNQQPQDNASPWLENSDDRLVRRRVRFISLAARYPRRWSWCLQSSLALREWLARDGVFADLKIGVQKHQGQLQAHAWLEYRGDVLNYGGSPVEEYVELQTDRGKLLSRLSEAGQETAR